jgi:putative MATE family efflux protein
MRRFWRHFLIAFKGTEKNFTEGSIRKAIFLLSVPMVLEMAMEALFAVVDVFFVSKISVEAVATVGLTESVLTLIYSIAIGLSTATTAMVARRIGEKKREDASVAAIQAILMAFLISTALSIPGYLFAGRILHLMGGTPELIEEGVMYTKIMFAGNYVIMFIFLLNAIFRGAGDASIAMRTLWISNLLNIILDPCFIFGLGPFPELGIMGAAVATNIGRGIGVIYQFYVLTRGNSIVRLRLRHFRVEPKIIRRLMWVATGGMSQYFIASASWIFLMRIIAIFGNEALAGYTIAIRIIIFTILPSWGMANAASTLVGQNLGANKPDRAESSVWMTSFYNMVFLLSVSVIFIIFAHPVISFFDDTPGVVYNGVMALRVICLGYAFFSYGMVISQAFNGAGDTLTPTIMNFICFWLIEIPFAYLLGITFSAGPVGVFASIAIAETVLAVICIVLFRRGKWKTVQI